MSAFVIIKEVLAALIAGEPFVEKLAEKVERMFANRELTEQEKAELDALLAEAAAALAKRVPLTERYPDPAAAEPPPTTGLGGTIAETVTPD